MSQTEVQLIKDAVIVNADISNSAAIDVSKISGALPAAGGTITGDVTFDGETAGRDIVFDRSDNALEFADNAFLKFGNSDDLKIYHNGTHSYLVDDGTGHLLIGSSLTHITNAAGNENCARFTENGKVELMFNNSTKFETTNTGVDILGSDTTGSNLNGDLVINNAAGTRYAVFDASHTKINFSDNAKITVGDSNDLQIFHDGSSSFISDEGTGSLKITTNGTGVDIQKGSSETIARFIADGAVELYHNNSKKFETTSGGATLTGTLLPGSNNTFSLGSASASWAGIHFGDHAEIRVGNATSGDLKIYHDGNDSYIDDAGTGSLLIRTTTSSNVSIKSSSAFMARFQTGDSVELYHNGNKKLETTSSGVDVTGALTVNGGSVGGGKVIQVLTATANVSSTSSGSFQSTGCSVNITPSNTANKILAVATGAMNNSGAGNGGTATIFRDSSNLAPSNDGMAGYFGEDNSNNIENCATFHVLDSPNTTSQVTYDIRLRAFSGTQRFGHRNTQRLTVIELDFS